MPLLGNSKRSVGASRPLRIQVVLLGSGWLAESSSEEGRVGLGTPAPSQHPLPGGALTRRVDTSNLQEPLPTAVSKLPSQDKNASVIVIVPGWSSDDNNFSEAVKKLLFGRIGADHSVDQKVPPPAVRTVIVHIFGRYGPYLARHMEGLTAQAHLRRQEMTFEPNMCHRGIIKERVDELLEPARPSSPKCCSCDRPADWITSCCSLMLCSYCMPDKFHQKHKRGHSRELCRAQGAIGLLNPRSPLEEETRYLMKNDMLCKREIILQVEDEESGRTRECDIFVLRSMLPLADLWNRKRLNRLFTCGYHMRWNGVLDELFRTENKLSFMK
ncbi:Os02g0784400 [Oryza sativa Japonica Group]|uniref:Uncharacterized protein n=3 Tax=Oryza TaxID=4527 RepID=A0A0P0VQH8_ORYSJ|nr:hypothetical protein EE612_014097 [Oryza sativa]BAD19295.1 hypothetical protein [Oryza sativa Japonica Group]BAD19553.1 hypothetical protein [Oryza sativa Japonica Group]BAS81259.1 Os02g0784400 [Oryza sativa Japonica Group]